MSPVPVAPMVSIGMPVFNGAAYIAESIESLLKQTYFNFELIISDNASTDHTAEICMEYVKRDSRIRFVRKERNRGALTNFQFVLDEARGDYFMWAACDDRWQEKYISSCVEVLNEHSECVSVFSHYRGLYLDTGVTTKIFSPTGSASDHPLTRVLTRLLDASPNLIYGIHRTPTLKAIGVGQFDWYDVYLSIALSVAGKILIVPKALFIAGAKTSRGGGGYSVTGKRVSLRRFRAEATRLVLENFRGARRLLLIAAVNYLAIRAQFSFWQRGI